MTEPIKTVCAWCGVTIREGTTPIRDGQPRVSHGICPTCEAKYFPKEGQ